jgi:prepilin-type N-terminal cleavage/methylation domain-containing protein
LLADHLRNESGYSLVEVMAAMMILSLAILPMVSMFDAGLRASMVGSNYDKARTLADERLEKVRALPYNKPGGSADSAVEIYRPGTPVTGTQGIFTYTVTTTFWRENAGNLEAVTDTSVTWPMMQVKVRVTWGAGNSYTTTGFVGLGGNP